MTKTRINKPWWRRRRVWLGMIISAFFIWKLVRGTPLGEVATAIRAANYWYCLPALVFYFLGVWFRAVRWRYILKPVGTISSRALFPYVVIGYAGNNVLPLRAGELVRAYITSRREGVRVSALLATIAVERIFDGLIMLAFIGYTALLLPLADPTVRFIAEMSGVLFAALFVIVLLLVFFKHRALSVISFILRLLPSHLARPLLDFASHFINGLNVVKSKLDVLAITLVSAFFWLLEALMYYYILLSFRHVFPPGFDAPFTLAIFTVAIVNLVIMLPSAPSYIGVFHQGCVVSLGIFKFLEANALSYATVLHVLLFVPITIWGLVYMITLKVPWGGFRSPPGKGATKKGTR